MTSKQALRTLTKTLTRRLRSRSFLHFPDLLEAEDFLLPQNIWEEHEWSTLFLIPTVSSATAAAAVVVVLLPFVVTRWRHLQHANRLNLKLIKLPTIRNWWFPIQELFVPFVNEIDIRLEENFRLEQKWGSLAEVSSNSLVLVRRRVHLFVICGQTLSSVHLHALLDCLL